MVDSEPDQVKDPRHKASLGWYKKLLSYVDYSKWGLVYG